MQQGWRAALRVGSIPGSLASITSTLALAWAGRRENGRAAAPVNATSHWLWDRESLHEDRTTVRHTLAGYLVHHGASMLWGVVHAGAFGRGKEGNPLAVLASGMATAAAACFVDLRMTPRRLTPGFEHRLSAASMAVVYASFGLGLALGTLALRELDAHRGADATAG
jgi:hypothetical protein